jgi:DNA modification methylase
MAAWKNRIISSGMVDPTTLNPNELNWRKHPDRQAKALSGTLDTLGWISDIIVNQQTGRMIDGHLRVELAIKNKEKEVPVKYVDLTPEEEELALLTLDPIGAMAEADKNMLEALMANVKTDDERVKALMGEIAQDYKIQKKVSEDDYEPPAEIETDIVRGDIYQLGSHRVMCGDSTSREDVDKLMDGKKADLLLTDPPYGIKRDKGFEGFGGFGGFGEPIKRRRYEDNDWDSSRPDKNTFDNILLLSEKIIIFGGNFFADLLPQGKHWIVWDKLNTMPTFGDCELIWTNIQRTSVKKIVFEYNGLIGKEKERQHPTQKPIKLITEIIVEYSKDGIILDPFLGSGTTLIACEQLDRICYGMEISPQYCEVICQRWEKLTGQTRIKLDEVNTE